MKRHQRVLFASLELWIFLWVLSIGKEGPVWGADLGEGLSISSLVFMNFTQASGDLVDTSPDKDISTSDAKKNLGLANGFHSTRIYLTLQKEISSQLLIRITTDQMTLRPDGNSEATPFGLSGFAGSGRGNLFIKFAYAEYKLPPALTLRVGLSMTPWIPTEEGRWTLRFLRPTFWDEQGVLTSSDMGIAAVGSVFNNLIGYHLMFSNGEGYQNNDIDGRGYAGQGRIDLNLIPGLTLSAFGYAETVHKGVSGWNPTREIFFAMYTHNLFRIAAQYMLADDNATGSAPVEVMTTPGSAATPSNPSGPRTGTGVRRLDQAKGYGSWAWIKIPGMEATRIFGRFYTIKPNTNTDAGKTTEINVGISYDISKELIVAVDDTLLNQKMLRTSDGSIETFKDNIVGIRAQLTF